MLSVVMSINYLKMFVTEIQFERRSVLPEEVASCDLHYMWSPHI